MATRRAGTSRAAASHESGSEPESDWVVMTHPDISHSNGEPVQSGVTHRSAYEAVWAEKGWEIAATVESPVVVSEETV